MKHLLLLAILTACAAPATLPKDFDPSFAYFQATTP
jgi:hypothetical protein